MGFWYAESNQRGVHCSVFHTRETYIHPDANYKECMERTQYYPSGLPWAEQFSNFEGVQPWKYNGKEFVEMHGYDVYEYGARGYYATIGRFTSIDPLCEQTPWQSPYVYANNNWVNNIDWMGMSADGFHIPTLNWVAVDEDGNVQGFDLFSDDKHVYLVDDSWDGTYEDLSPDDIIGWQIPRWTDYRIGKPCYYLGSVTKVTYLGDQITVIGSTALMYGKHSVTASADDNGEAVLWYFFGFGRDRALGDQFTRQWLMIHPEFNRKYNEIINAPMPSSGQFSINMTEFIFHIGKSNINYYTTNNYSVFSIGIRDAFCDVLYWFEKSEDNPYGITPDGKGWLLEVGIPYSYIPTAVLIPHQY